MDSEQRAIDITRDPNYRIGYDKGFKEGYAKALEQFGNMIFHNATNPQIIVTTEENMNQLREKLGKIQDFLE